MYKALSTVPQTIKNSALAIVFSKVIMEKLFGDDFDLHKN